jgi:ParB-like chromosome segregation protein Spo0J
MTDAPQIHPAAAVFPMLSDDELKVLADDIKANGQREPIIKTPLGVIIDGRNRLAACQMLGITPFYKDIILDEGEVASYVISKNIHRRHLTKEKQAYLIVKAMEASTDLAKSARSVKRNDDGRMAGSTKDPAKEAVVQECEKYGISKRTAEKAIGKTKPARETRTRVTSPTRRPTSAAKPLAAGTPVLLKGEEDRVIDQQIDDTKKAVERLVGYARSLGRVQDIIRALRVFLDRLEAL